MFEPSNGWPKDDQAPAPAQSQETAPAQSQETAPAQSQAPAPAQSQVPAVAQSQEELPAASQAQSQVDDEDPDYAFLNAPMEEMPQLQSSQDSDCDSGYDSREEEARDFFGDLYKGQ
eukprot:COSAG02_NODE_27552_length_607_cov_0.687008_1_plen_117_part_00